MKRLLLAVGLLCFYSLSGMEEVDNQSINLREVNANFGRLTHAMFERKQQKANFLNRISYIEGLIALHPHMIRDLTEKRDSFVDYCEQLIQEQNVLLLEIAEIKLIIDRWNETAQRPLKIVVTKKHDPAKHKKRKAAQKKEHQFKTLEDELTNKMIIALTINKECSQLDQQILNLDRSYKLAAGFEGADLILNQKSELENRRDNFYAKKKGVVDGMNTIVSELSNSKEEFLHYCGLITQKAHLKMKQSSQENS